MYELVNLTPHAIVLRSESGTDTVLPPSGTVARVQSADGVLCVIPGLPVPVKGSPIYGGVIGLPRARSGVYYVVSAMVGARVAGRTDVLCPGTGPNDNAVRENGQIVAVTCLVRP